MKNLAEKNDIVKEKIGPELSGLKAKQRNLSFDGTISPNVQQISD